MTEPPGQPRLLFVKLKHIGDALMLTPTLSAARTNYPGAMIWVVVRHGTEGILDGCPAIDRVLTAAAPETVKRTGFSWWHDFMLTRALRRQHFDFAFELTDGDRGRWIACLSGARTRCANTVQRPLRFGWQWGFNGASTYEWRSHHRVEKDFHTVNEFLPLGETIPELCFVRERTQRPALGQVPATYAVLHPGTRWQRKRWLKERWIELGRHLLTRLPQLVLSVGPDPEEIALAGQLQAALGPQVLNSQGRLSWVEMAGLLYEALLFVGVDTAAMHLAAACQCPTVAIFGPSTPVQWRPWRVEHRLVRPSAAALANRPDIEQTEAVELAEVIRACEDLLAQSP
jgi:heptosyltransferase-3